jgi:DNA repair exonuclease SbcCD ATPase subunit
MFKKNLYSFCALIALSCSAYAMEDDLAPSVEEKGGRNALRASTASLSIDDQEPSEASQSSPASSTPSAFFPNNEEKVTFTWAALEQAGSFQNPNPDPRAKALRGFLHELFSSKMKPGVHYELPILQRQLDGNIWDLMNDKEQISKAIEEANASSPASSVPNSLFSNDEAKATFSWGALMAAVERGESRAKKLHEFLMEKYRHDEIKWDEKPFYKMPFSQKQLDEELWTIYEPFEAKLAIAVGNIPTTRETITKLAAAIGSSINDTSTHKDREIELRTQALKAVDKLNALKEKISSTEADFEASKAQVAVKEEAERQLTSQLKAQGEELEASKAQVLAKEETERQLTSQLTAQGEELKASKAQVLSKEKEAEELTSRLTALEAALKKFKEDTDSLVGGLKASLAEKSAQNQLLQSAVDDVKTTLAAAGERLASLSTQASE